MLEHYSQNSREDKHADPDRQQHLPSYFHELIEAVTRERGAIPDIQIHEAPHLRDEPEDILNAIPYRRHEQDEADESQHGAESGQANRLDSKVRMLRHPPNADEGNHCQAQESQSRKERKYQVPSLTGQCVGKRPVPSAKPKR